MEKLNKGITLIALVITIIIMLILAGVALNLTLGEHGMFKIAGDAASEYEKAKIKEEIELAVMDIEHEEIASGNELTLEKIEEKLPGKLNNITAQLEDNKIVGEYKGYEYEIDNKFNVTIGKNNGTNIDEEEEKGEQFLFTYTGDYQEFQAKKAGYYKIECFGADGGKARADGVLSGKGGIGGYTSGTIYLNKNEKIYVYVGGKGEDAVTSKDVKGGYNGGGLGTWDRSDDDASGAGGGATDIRLVNGEWDNFDSLKSRIMVAGGGARS